MHAEMSARRLKPIELARRNVNLLLLIAFIAAGALVSDSFFTERNILNIMRQVSVNGIMAVGFTFVALAGGFDLSIGSTLAVCACFCTGFLSSMNMWVAIAACIAVGAFIGCLNGLMIKVTRGGLSETFLITLGMSLVGQCVAMSYTRGYSMYVPKGSPYLYLGQGALLGVPASVLLLIALMVLGQFVLSRTRYGRKIYLTGGNKETAFASGVNTHAVKTSVFVIAGACAAIAGIVHSSRTTTAVYTMGEGADFDACIAVFIGGNKLGGGKGGMLQTLIGVLIYGLISNILNLGGVGSSAQQISKGAVLLLAIVLDGVKRD